MNIEKYIIHKKQSDGFNISEEVTIPPLLDVNNSLNSINEVTV